MENNRISLNKNYIQKVLEHRSVLELYPFLFPFIINEKVKYLDTLSIDDMKKKAEISGVHYDSSILLKKIHYVIPDDDWSPIHEKYEAVFSSHSIECQPDLIKHLQNVSMVLEETGSYFLCVPDKRFCADHYNQVTTLWEIIDRYNDEEISFKTYLSSRLKTHNNAQQHWNHEHGEIVWTSSKVKQFFDEYQACKKDNQRRDLRRWYFTPVSFYTNIFLLYRLGFINLFPIVVTDTLPNSFEFYAQLVKMDGVEIGGEFSVPEYLSDSFT